MTWVLFETRATAAQALVADVVAVAAAEPTRFGAVGVAETACSAPDHRAHLAGSHAVAAARQPGRGQIASDRIQDCVAADNACGQRQVNAQLAGPDIDSGRVHEVLEDGRVNRPRVRPGGQPAAIRLTSHVLSRGSSYGWSPGGAVGQVQAACCRPW